MDLLNIYLLGLLIAFTVGPITLLLVQRSVSKGLGSGIASAVGIALADFTCAIIAFSVGVPILRILESHRVLVHLFSGLVLLALAAYIFWGSLKKFRKKQHIVAAQGKGTDFLSGYLLTIHNPLTIGVFLGLLSYLTSIHSVSGVILYAFVLFLGSLTGQLTIAFTASSLRKFFQDPKSIFILNALSAAGIAVFAIMNFAKLF